MTKHTEIRRKLSDFLDDAVTPAEKAVIEAHLAQCPQCRKAHEDLKKTIAHMKGLPEVEPPPWLTERIMAKVREEAGRPSLWRRIFLPLHVKLPMEAFAVLFVCIMGYYLAHTNAPLVLPPSAPTVKEVPAVPAPATAPATAPQAIKPPAAQSIPSRANAPKSPGSAPRQATPEPKAPQRQSVQEPSAPAPLQPPQAPLTRALPSSPPASQAPSAARPPSPAPLSLQSAPAPETAPRSTEAYGAMAREMMAAKQLRSSEDRAGASAESMRQYKAADTLEGTAPPYPAEAGEAPAPPAVPPGAHWEESAQEWAPPPPSRVEFSLKVNDPAGAVAAIERAVGRSGGTIVRRDYSDSQHLLMVRMERAKVATLARLLAKIGTIKKEPKPRDEKGSTVEVTIAW